MSQWMLPVLWFAAVLSVAGQATDVTQCIASYNWSINSLDQNPCLVAAYLESACGTPTTIPAIPDIPGDHYLGPNGTLADPCRCSSVTYSMISACAGCQNRTYTDWVTWSADCFSVSFMTFPKSLTSAVVVPGWAFLNLTLTGNNFSVAAAKQNASASALTSSAIPTSTSASIPIPSTTVASTSKSKSNAGAIAGGVVGGLVFLAILALVALWYRMRRKRNMVQQDVAFDSRALVAGTAMSQTAGSIQGASQPSQPSQSIYTSDMSIYPGSPLTTSGVFTSGVPPTSSRRSLESVSLSLAQFGAGSQAHGNVQPRGYTGMPEI